jgi:light-regulated signal transduction histidine kinase (bacteriophytochrome)
MGERISVASENAAEYLEVPLKPILGSAIETLLGRELLAVIRALDRYSELAGQLIYLGSFPLRNELYSVVTHLVDGQRVLEFEEIDQLVSPDIELCRAITK